MNELMLELDCFSHKDFKNYLLSLLGVFEVNIINEETLIINIKYDPKLTNPVVLKTEVILFLDMLKVPSILSFNKHFNTKTYHYKITIKDLCCEYCFKGMIDELLMINGIEKASSTDNIYDNTKNIVINVNYDPNLIRVQNIEKLELEFNS